MAKLFSQYASGVQFTAGSIIGSSTGASGINQIVDRLNSISTDDNLIVGSVISGTNTNVYTPYQQGNVWTGSLISGTSTNIITNYQNGSNWQELHSGTSANVVTPYQNSNHWSGSLVSGTNLEIYASGGWDEGYKRRFYKTSRTFNDSSVSMSSWSHSEGSVADHYQITYETSGDSAYQFAEVYGSGVRVWGYGKDSNSIFYCALNRYSLDIPGSIYITAYWRK